MRILLHLMVASFMFGEVGCKKDDDDDADEAPKTGSLAIPVPTTPYGVTVLLDTTVKSSLSSSSASEFRPTATGSLAVGSSLAQADLAAGDATEFCSTKGNPISGDATQDTEGTASGGDSPLHLALTNKDFAFGKFYCLLNHNTGEEQSVQGAYGTVTRSLCFTKDIIVFDGQMHSIDISDVANNPCFSGNASEAPSSLTLQATTSKPAAFGGSGWDYSVDVNLLVPNESGGTTTMNYKYLFKSDINTIAFAALAKPVGDTSANDWDAFVLSLRPQLGELRYEFKSQRIGKGDGTIATRLLTTGTIDETGSFSKLDRYDGFTLRGNESDGDHAISSYLSTIKGSLSNGFRTANYSCQPGSGCSDTSDYSKWTKHTASTDCYLNADGCKDVSPLILASNENAKVAMIPTLSDFLAADTWFSSMVLPTYDTVLLLDRQ